MRNQRGAVLAIVIPTALVCAIAAYAVLQASVSEARHAAFIRGRTQSRYLAEAAIVYVRERLWLDPGYCPASVPIDIDMDAVPLDPDDINVNVSFSTCVAGSPRAITASVNY